MEYVEEVCYNIIVNKNNKYVVYELMMAIKILISGCRTNQECLMKDHIKPICGSDGICVRGLS